MKYHTGSKLNNLQVIPYLNYLGEEVARPEEAEIFAFPHFWGQIKEHGDYIDSLVSLAKSLSKKVIIVAPGDSDAEINVPESIVFRNSKYRSTLRSNEIIIPGFADDLLVGRDLVIREKGEKPVVGFCGWAGFVSFDKHLRYLVKIFISQIKSLLGDSEALVRRQGLWFRRQAIKILGRSPLVITNFIIRRSYSGTAKTAELDLKQARLEYINNMLGSDFVLCVKGDGNFSVRFFEALSLGRIPLLVDTDCLLPLENLINYDEFVVKVDYRELAKLPAIVSEVYKNWSAEDYGAKQRRAREVFEQY
jgi:hypothetical protein